MATHFNSDRQRSLDESLMLKPEERMRLEKRRKDVRDYEPPKWKSSRPDPVSGNIVERPMVPHASIRPYVCPSRHVMQSRDSLRASQGLWYDCIQGIYTVAVT